MHDALTMSRRRFLLALALALLTVLLALVSRWEAAHHFITGEASACRISDALDCDKVQTSAYATVLGVSLATWGMGGGILLAALLIAYRTAGWPLILRLAGLLALFDLVAALALFGIATFAIGATCLYCLGIQLCCLLLAIVVVPAAWRAPRTGPVRTALGTAALMAAAVLLLVFAGETWVVERAGFLRAHTRPKGATLRVDVSDALVVGDPNTPISVLIYFDFGCPACRACSFKALELTSRFPRQVHVFFKHWPLDAECNSSSPTIHPGACRAAVAGQAAALAGKSRAALRRIFQITDFYPHVLRNLAEDLRIPPDRWKALRESGEVKGLVQRDLAEGNAMHFNQVPMVYVNGRNIDPQRLVPRVERLVGR